jgi:pimeloyl-ACP methyl ester carboxylesterase
MTASASTGTLAFDDEGTGTPVVFLHGLTFDRRTWRPIIDRLEGVRSVAIDLPAHGESAGEPAGLDEVADQVHALLLSLGIESPIVVAHSMSVGIAAFYASSYPTAGLVFVDSGPELKPFAELVQRLEPALRSPQFPEVWRTFEESMRLDRIPEPTRSLVLETHVVDQDTVLGYWEMLLRTAPDELQRQVDAQVRATAAPVLGVFGRELTAGERERFGWSPTAEVEEWVGGGHFVHLVDVPRFTDRLLQFVETQTSAPA